MANKYIQAGLPNELHKEFMALVLTEDRKVAKMGEILIREALAARRINKDK